MIQKILTMCSTKARPVQLVRMIRSFERTRKCEDNKLVVYCSQTDTKISQYRSLPEDIRKYIQYGPSKNIVQIYNDLATKQYPNFQFYKQLHDDMVCITDAWDIELMNTINDIGHGWGMAVPSDNIIPGNVGGWMMSGKLIRALGWVLLPTLTAISTDSSLKSILQPLRLIFPRLDVIIDHVCWHDGKRGFGSRAPFDQAAQWSYSPQANMQAAMGLAGFNPLQHIKKIKIAMDEDLRSRGIA